MATDRRALRRQLFAVAAEQAGYFTAGQAKDIGYTYPAQAHHVKAGNWLRVHRGLFRLADWIPGLHDDLAMWSLWSRRRATVSHDTALAVHNLGEFESARVHLTVPANFTMNHPALTLHHSELPDNDIQDHGTYRLTTPTRTLIDIAAGAPDEHQLARAVTEAHTRGLTTLRTLRGRAEAADTRAALYIERAIHLAQLPTNEIGDIS